MAFVTDSLDNILQRYQISFGEKGFAPESDASDLLMELFDITASMKRENRQYWGRELGLCWQRLVVETCRQTCSDFGPALRYGADEPCDLTIGTHAIDTKYRIGSGDSGTLKKFRSNAALLRQLGYEPILLILREDNLPAALTACQQGGWRVLAGAETYSYIYEMTAFNLREYLRSKRSAYKIGRT